MCITIAFPYLTRVMGMRQLHVVRNWCIVGMDVEGRLVGKRLSVVLDVVFFFQAEDGIRDHCVTGVQTCALPICLPALGLHGNRADRERADGPPSYSSVTAPGRLRPMVVILSRAMPRSERTRLPRDRKSVV